MKIIYKSLEKSIKYFDTLFFHKNGIFANTNKKTGGIMNSIWNISNQNNTLKNSQLHNISNSLSCDITTDILIIGAGITGITTGYLLSQEGCKVTIVDKGTIAHETSSHTTAKITSQHDLFYSYLIKQYSLEFAKLYLEANENAITNIFSIIQKEQIDCDFHFDDSYLYTNQADSIAKLIDEYQALQLLNFPAELVSTLPSPIPSLSALKFPNQARFHPVKYIHGLAKCILNKNNSIYQNTCITDIKKTNDGYLASTDNHKIKANKIVLACHYPIKDIPGFYFMKLYQETSYLIAIDPQKPVFNGLYLSIDEPSFSFRKANFEDKDILLIGGMSHKTGAKIDLSQVYHTLFEQAKLYYPNSKLLYQWCSQDTISLDKIPYIGKFSSFYSDFYVATGFKKWGMTTSNVAANILCDCILGRKNRYAKIFDSKRFKPIKNHKELSNMIKESSYSLLLNRFKIPTKKIDDIALDTGEIIKIKNKIIGVYKDSYGNIFAVSPFCSHLHCMLAFNNLEKTWDCPCHGSRFNYKGKSLYNPAVKDLKQIDYSSLL